MELKKDFTKIVTIGLMADEEGYDEITPFASAFQKIYEDSSKVGFKNRFTPNEQQVLKGIWENLQKDALLPVKETDKKTG